MAQRRRTWLGMGIAIVALLIVAVLTGCGHAPTPKDPFVGTWREVDSTAATPLVIAKTEFVYLATFDVPYRFHLVFGAFTVVMPLSRQGDRLVGQLSDFHGEFVAEIVPLPESGRLTFSQAMPGVLAKKSQEMVKVSDSTVASSPSP
jgi:hypothetical protein